jgi:steroid delta-isomerase-like uncharacterized protein
MRTVTGAAHARSMTTTEITTTDLRSRRQQTVADQMAAECRHDIPATLATFSEANYDVVPLGAPTPGAAAVDELLQGLFAAFPDFQAEALSVHHGDDIVYVDTRMTGTHDGPWAGIPASGRSIDVRCGCIFHFDEDRLVKETVFFDHATLLAQIGVGG